MSFCIDLSIIASTCKGKKSYWSFVKNVWRSFPNRLDFYGFGLFYLGFYLLIRTLWNKGGAE